MFVSVESEKLSNFDVVVCTAVGVGVGGVTAKIGCVTVGDVVDVCVNVFLILKSFEFVV